MPFQIGDKVLYATRCPHENTQWLIPGVSTGTVIQVNTIDFNGEETYRYAWDVATLNQAIISEHTQRNHTLYGNSGIFTPWDNWWVSPESIEPLTMGPVHKWHKILHKVKTMQEKRKEQGYAF